VASSDRSVAAWATGAENGIGWMPQRTMGGPQWLEVTFATARRARALRVRELTRAPFVGRVDLIDEQGGSHTVFEGGDTTANGNWLEVKLQAAPYKVAKARIWTSVSFTSAWDSEQIDAVKLEGGYEEGYGYNGFNQLTSVTGSDGASTSYGYDGNGNQTSKSETPAGGTSQLTQYVYNLDNRLVGIALPNGLSNAFEYDANGLRTRKTDSGGASAYLLDGMSIIGQYAQDGTRQAFYTQSLARIDEVLSVVNGAGKYWYEADALGSVYTLTTASGIVQARGGYDVFGAPVAEYGAAVGQPLGFSGREHDLDAGLVYARARYVNPAAGRFVAPDRLSVSSARNGGLAADPGVRQLLRTAGGFVTDVPEYSYAANDPTVLADPSGLTVMYVGVGATAATFAGGATGGFGMGLGGSPFGLAFLATFGLAFQAGLINISVSTDVGIYFALDHDSVCDLKGPFLVEGADFGLMGVSLAWGVRTEELEAALARGTLALPAVSKLPVGIVFSFPILPTGYLPSGGITLYATWSWILAGGGCGC
jgi:RHS repeat-associated protein